MENWAVVTSCRSGVANREPSPGVLFPANPAGQACGRTGPRGINYLEGTGTELFNNKLIRLINSKNQSLNINTLIIQLWSIQNHNSSYQNLIEN